jgi:hypothetical protein
MCFRVKVYRVRITHTRLPTVLPRVQSGVRTVGLTTDGGVWAVLADEAQSMPKRQGIEIAISG